MKREDIHRIMHPQSIAVVGVSNDIYIGATMFLKALLGIGYKGRLYAVDKFVDSALGMKTYPSLLHIPEKVDHVIVGVPAAVTPLIMEDAVKKEVRSIHFFTSGFAEVASSQGRALQAKLVEIAGGSVRIIGPNCMGIYSPEMKIAFSNNQSSVSGGAGFVSQSGGMAMLFSEHAQREGNYCSKLISIGNSCDLKLTDFFEYLSEDQDTTSVSMYVEGLAKGEGKKFVEIVRETSPRKPVLVYKAGQTAAGARAASSHTGSMAGEYRLWRNLARQCGVVLVESIEEMHDFLKLRRMVEAPASTRCCLVGGGGGASVTTTDEGAKWGIDLPELQEQTQQKLLEFIVPVGTIRRNPVDMNMGSWDPRVVENVVLTVGGDPQIDTVIYLAQTAFVAIMAEEFGVEPKAVLDAQVACLVSAREKSHVPIVCTVPAIFEEPALEEFRSYLRKELESRGLPTLPTMERTAKAIQRCHEYRRFIERP
ncbi:CoA-binding protein [Thermodesulfobacteriota bacterium]